MEMTICAAYSAVIVTVFLGRVFSPGGNEALFILRRPDDALGLRHVPGQLHLNWVEKRLDDVEETI